MLAWRLYKVTGESMTPAFRPGEYLLVSRAAYTAKTPARGEVVVVADPREPGKHYLKRIVGLPGEEVRLHEGVLLINGERLHEPYLGGLPAYLGLGRSTWKLGGAEYFAMGDNRAHSTDSREFGPVTTDDIVGKARFRVWPLRRWGAVN